MKIFAHFCMKKILKKIYKDFHISVYRWKKRKTIQPFAHFLLNMEKSEENLDLLKYFYIKRSTTQFPHKKSKIEIKSPLFAYF